MERLFADFLAQLRPRPEYLKLFGEIVVDVWKQRKAISATEHEAALSHLNAVAERKQLLIEAFVYKRLIDSATARSRAEAPC